jgi:hypothetical protein
MNLLAAFALIAILAIAIGAISAVMTLPAFRYYDEDRLVETAPAVE